MAPKMHVNIKTILTILTIELLKRNLVRGLDNININDMHCNSCSVSKSTEAPCKELGSRQTKNVLELIHSDLCGPMPIKSIGGAKYFAPPRRHLALGFFEDQL